MQSQTRHLPQTVTPFVGREQELADVDRRLADPACRLLTLVGPGGMGKTRLAVQVGAVTPHFPDGVYFVNLQPIQQADLLLTAVADTLDIPLSDQAPLLETLRSQMANQQSLLILDNFEQLLDAAPLLSDLLNGTHIKCLITSRETLNLQEEWLYPLTGIAFPSQTLPADELATYDAIQLFADRAQRVRPDFNLEAESEAVARICQMVEGMPLALELAAPWMKSMNCTEIAAEIERNRAFLATRLRNVPERHRSVQAIFAQTWHSLTEDEQTVFQQLSVFRGGFKREAATAVTGASLPHLTSLLDKSLLRWESDEAGNGRYQIHELLRQYAADKLAENPAEAEATVRRHTQYFTRFLSDNLDHLLGNYQQNALTDIHAELENVRFAWNQLVDHADIAGLKQAVMPLLSFFWHRSRFVEGRNLFRQAIVVLQPLPPSCERDLVLAMAQSGLAIFLMGLGHFDESTALATTAQQLYEKHQLPPPLGMDSDPRLTMANNARLLGDYDTAIAHATAALAHNQHHHNLRNTQEAYRMLAEIQIGQQALTEAWHNAKQSFALAQQGNDLCGLAYAHETLGGIAFAQEKDDLATHHYETSYALWRQLGHWVGQADMLQRLGDLAFRRHDYTAAKDYFAQCLPLFEDKHVAGGVLGTLVRLGETAVYQAQPEAASQRFLKAIPIALAFPDQFGGLTSRLLLGAANLLLMHGIVAEAVTLLAHLTNYPQLQHDDLAQVQKLLEVGKKGLTDEEFETAVSQGQTAPMETHLSALKDLLSAPLPDQAAASTLTPPQPLVDPLTNRELEVLHLIADGLTNQQIADKLIIAKGTVKYYTSNIYSKLQASSRTAAIAQARELGILP